MPPTPPTDDGEDHQQGSSSSVVRLPLSVWLSLPLLLLLLRQTKVELCRKYSSPTHTITLSGAMFRRAGDATKPRRQAEAARLATYRRSLCTLSPLFNSTCRLHLLSHLVVSSIHLPFLLLPFPLHPTDLFTTPNI
jgi:hypothetical protein